MKTNVYVDGFNLYYGCVKSTPYKWLDLSALCRILLPKHQIHRIRYFTSRVWATADDPQMPQRQDIFLRALKTIPNLSIHYGHFLSHHTRMPLAHPSPNRPKTVEVIKTEEKGSDVNLATFLLVDGFQSDYEQAVVISNDSDLLKPISLVREKLGFPIGVFNPHKETSWALRNAATFYRRIRLSALQASQFPHTLKDAQGIFAKPARW